MEECMINTAEQEQRERRGGDQRARDPAIGEERRCQLLFWQASRVEGTRTGGILKKGLSHCVYLRERENEREHLSILPFHKAKTHSASRLLPRHTAP